MFGTWVALPVVPGATGFTLFAVLRAPTSQIHAAGLIGVLTGLGLGWMVGLVCWALVNGVHGWRQVGACLPAGGRGRGHDDRDCW